MHCKLVSQKYMIKIVKKFFKSSVEVSQTILVKSLILMMFIVVFTLDLSAQNQKHNCNFMV
jgi:hypothetical protein